MPCRATALPRLAAPRTALRRARPAARALPRRFPALSPMFVKPFYLCFLALQMFG